ncbi:hypothetical protein N7539_003809 [Penicillium diatomitis]|uniref:Crh-like protein n=1 Tax=Penicillium diatomitis TaxID=2819901 RepID=A0A9W9XCK9_9EURO|nr:uncharacterized protein N7539_003809 [Penicillium diatomitis]KAJ5488919.1 hypothetical protein N7539_003809 [Penicillium diatomitis]
MYPKYHHRWALVALAATPLCAAQTFTSCNPLEKTCAADVGLPQWEVYTDFTSGSAAFNRWNTTAGKVENTSLGAKFTISAQGDAPTIESDFYIFFGRVEVNMKAANGTGIISTTVMESDDLDEIDWEQISTYDSSIQTDYFGKGNTTLYNRDTTVSVTRPEEQFHTYTVDWTSERIEWLLDGKVVRTLEYADALGGQNYPQTPMRIKIGIWAGGDPNNAQGTITWAGGETDYTTGPFTMYVDSVRVLNYNPASAYTYTDKTGAYTSIKATNSTTSNDKALSSAIVKSANASSSDVSGSTSSSSSVSRSAITATHVSSLTSLPVTAVATASTASVSPSSSPSTSSTPVSAASATSPMSAGVTLILTMVATLLQL